MVAEPVRHTKRRRGDLYTSVTSAIQRCLRHSTSRAHLKAAIVIRYWLRCSVLPIRTISSNTTTLNPSPRAEHPLTVQSPKSLKPMLDLPTLSSLSPPMMDTKNHSPNDLPKGPQPQLDLFLGEHSPSAKLSTTSSVGVPTPSSSSTNKCLSSSATRSTEFIHHHPSIYYSFTSMVPGSAYKGQARSNCGKAE